MDEHANKDLLSLEAGILNLKLSPMTAISSRIMRQIVCLWLFVPGFSANPEHSASVRMHGLCTVPVNSDKPKHSRNANSTQSLRLTAARNSARRSYHAVWSVSVKWA